MFYKGLGSIEMVLRCMVFRLYARGLAVPIAEGRVQHFSRSAKALEQSLYKFRKEPREEEHVRGWP